MLCPKTFVLHILYLNKEYTNTTLLDCDFLANINLISNIFLLRFKTGIRNKKKLLKIKLKSKYSILVEVRGKVITFNKC